MLDFISKAAEGIVSDLSRRGFLSEVGKAVAPFVALVGGLGNNQAAAAEGKCCYWYCNGEQVIRCRSKNQTCAQTQPGFCDLSGSDDNCDCPSEISCCQYNCPGLIIPGRGVVVARDTHQLCAGEGDCERVITDPRWPNGYPIPGRTDRKANLRCFLSGSTTVESCDDCPEG